MMDSMELIGDSTEEVIPQLRRCPLQSLPGSKAHIGDHAVESIKPCRGGSNKSLTRGGIPDKASSNPAVAA